MKILAGFVISLFLCGCQVDPYTHSPTWTGTDWYDAGMEDALAGFAAKDNETLAQTYNDRAVNRSYYLRGYSEGQRKTCEPGLMFARGFLVRLFLPVVKMLKTSKSCMKNGKLELMKMLPQPA